MDGLALFHMDENVEGIRFLHTFTPEAAEASIADWLQIPIIAKPYQYCLDAAMVSVTLLQDKMDKARRKRVNRVMKTYKII
ncbi:hypothetical protein CHS0354_011817 [Potamilus streckersoni]|uniref:Uncharacterized protein n=1 Tax=Potamilus streckersoni TaxID=2493646 RepID=A0AAE0THB7_9BIVA|nr:hypothetical protein CHS0354_011817 [Potamilus streckersoni]